VLSRSKTSLVPVDSGVNIEAVGFALDVLIQYQLPTMPLPDICGIVGSEFLHDSNNVNSKLKKNTNKNFIIYYVYKLIVTMHSLSFCL
jgi:hypothetical protein